MYRALLGNRKTNGIYKRDIYDVSHHRIVVVFTPNKHLKIDVVSLGFVAFFGVPVANGDTVRINTFKNFEVCGDIIIYVSCIMTQDMVILSFTVTSTMNL